jgi:glycosyltransferase involved in cell wall biosynthesis
MSLANVPVALSEDDECGGAADTAPRRLTRWFPGGATDPTNGLHVAPEQLGIAEATDLKVTATRPARPRVSVIVPTYNEAKNLPHVLSGIPPDTHEVIVVDGHSVDGTVETARFLRPDVRIVLQNRHGKGNAMACGFAAATGDVMVMLDADGSADPTEIARFVGALTDGADFAKGSRFFQDGGSADITRLRAWGNRWLNRIANLLFGTPYTDLCYGYNAFWRDCLDRLELDPRPGVSGGRLWGDGFEIETIINTRVAKAGLSIAEVPSYEYARLHGNSNLNTWRDGGRVVRALLVERFNGKGTRRRHRFVGNVVTDTQAAWAGEQETVVATEAMREAI